MQIDHLAIENFNGFAHREFSFNPRFNLLVGDNATGKTSVLDAGNARSSVESRNPRLAHFTTLCAVSQLRTWTVLELPGPGLAPGFVCAL